MQTNGICNDPRNELEVVVHAANGLIAEESQAQTMAREQPIEVAGREVVDVAMRLPVVPSRQDLLCCRTSLTFGTMTMSRPPSRRDATAEPTRPSGSFTCSSTLSKMMASAIPIEPGPSKRPWRTSRPRARQNAARSALGSSPTYRYRSSRAKTCAKPPQPAPTSTTL